MFRTTASVALKEDTRIKGRDVKKLRSDIAAQFRMSEEDMNTLMPAKVPPTQAALSTTSAQPAPKRILVGTMCGFEELVTGILVVCDFPASSVLVGKEGTSRKGVSGGTRGSIAQAWW